MSLFPAYNNNNNKNNDDDENSSSTESESTEADSSNNNNNNKWLENSSFIPIEKLLSAITDDTKGDANNNDNVVGVVGDKSEKNKDDDDDTLIETNRKRKHKELKTKKKRKKDKKKHEKSSPKPEEEKMEFTGNEEYYVDKSSQRSYLNVMTLSRPSCPKYRIYSKTIGLTRWQSYSKLFMKKRYFQISKRSSSSINDADECQQLNDIEFMAKTKGYQKLLGENPSDISAWLELIHLQDKTPMKIVSKSQLTERKMTILDRALKENPSNDQIYYLYIDIINKTYPSFEVSKILDNLIKIDPTNYVLWNAQILATQSSMARCNVPDVLRLYELCMKSMYKRNHYDEVMLKLFTNCLFFLRQCGLYEHFFSLIKLSFELNVMANKFSSIRNNATVADEHILIEYEEVILKSGLPMAELWFRIEKLRQNFMFLPIDTEQQETSGIDPQRVVFCSDIVQYVYPLKNVEYTFQLILIILRLMKIPILNYGSLKNNAKWFLHKNEETYSQFDCIEELFSIFLYRHFISDTMNGGGNSVNNQFDCIFFDLIKDFCNGPSYLSTTIGYEQYLKVSMEILLITIDCYTDYCVMDGNNPGLPSSASLFSTNNMLKKQQRNILILIWLRFERIIYYLDVLMDKVTVDKQRKLCLKIKNFLKRPENRSNILFYIEYAIIEYEMGRCNTMENILIKAIDQCLNDDDRHDGDDGDDDDQSTNMDNNFTRSTLTFAYITYAELMLKEKQYDKAINILICLVLKENISNAETIPTETKKLLALKTITEQLDNLIEIEKTIVIMELEQYFLPDLFCNLLRAKFYLLLLIKKSHTECLHQLDGLLKKTFAIIGNDLHDPRNQNDRHKFIRENLYELQIKLLSDEFFISSSSSPSEHKINYLKLYECVGTGLEEFPKNLLLLKVATTHFDSFTWQKVSRLLFTKSNTIDSIIFLIVAAKLRYKKRCNDQWALQPAPPSSSSASPSSKEQNNIDNFIQLISSQVDTNECTYKLRVINLLRNILGNEQTMEFRKNSLLWRLYLRSLLDDINVDFEKSKNILFAALDECPWNKALYLDGGIFVPQELSHLQDLMLEKQLRVYALPDELEILRSEDLIE